MAENSESNPQDDDEILKELVSLLLWCSPVDRTEWTVHRQWNQPQSTKHWRRSECPLPRDFLLRISKDRWHAPLSKSDVVVRHESENLQDFRFRKLQAVGGTLDM